jgi:hypothetical protein
VYPRLAKMFMMCHRMGLPPISTIGLGRRTVSSESRDPNPPARMIVFMARLARLGVNSLARSGATGVPGLPDLLSTQNTAGSRLLGLALKVRLDPGLLAVASMQHFGAGPSTTLSFPPLTMAYLGFAAEFTGEQGSQTCIQVPAGVSAVGVTARPRALSRRWEWRSRVLSQASTSV